MLYVTREVEEVRATAKVFDMETEEMREVSMTFYDGETDKQMERAFEKEGYKVLKIVRKEERKYIGRMTRKMFAEMCEYYKEER